MPYTPTLESGTSWGDVEDYITMCVKVSNKVYRESAMAVLMELFSSILNHVYTWLINIHRLCTNTGKETAAKMQHLVRQQTPS